MSDEVRGSERVLVEGLDELRDKVTDAMAVIDRLLGEE